MSFKYDALKDQDNIIAYTFETSTNITGHFNYDFSENRLELTGDNVTKTTSIACKIILNKERDSLWNTIIDAVYSSSLFSSRWRKIEDIQGNTCFINISSATKRAFISHELLTNPALNSDGVLEALITAHNTVELTNIPENNHSLERLTKFEGSSREIVVGMRNPCIGGHNRPGENQSCLRFYDKNDQECQNDYENTQLKQFDATIWKKEDGTFAVTVPFESQIQAKQIMEDAANYQEAYIEAVRRIQERNP